MILSPQRYPPMPEKVLKEKVLKEKDSFNRLDHFFGLVLTSRSVGIGLRRGSRLVSVVVSVGFSETDVSEHVPACLAFANPHKQSALHV